jgi:hypothetical protein
MKHRLIGPDHLNEGADREAGEEWSMKGSVSLREALNGLIEATPSSAPHQPRLVENQAERRE